MENGPKLRITFNTRDEFALEWERNISKGGIFLKTDSPPAIRQRVSVVIEVLDFGATFELAGEAVHVSGQGVGVQLQPLPLDVAESIRDLLSAEAFPEKEEAESPTKTDETTYQAIQNMSRHEKLAFARKGGMDARAILLRDRDPKVVMSVLLNPRITVAEVIQLSSSQSLTLDMIKMIVNRAEWLSVESVCLNLVLNPKMPLPTALSLLNRLSEKNVRMLAKRPIKQAIKSAALKMVVKK